MTGRADHENKTQRKSSFPGFSPQKYFLREARVSPGSLGSNPQSQESDGAGCTVRLQRGSLFPCRAPWVADGSPPVPRNVPPAPDAGPPAINLQRGANAPSGGGARLERRDRNKTVSRNAGCVLGVSGGRRAGEDLREKVPTAAKEAMAMGVWGLCLWRAAPGGRAGCSEFQRPWGRKARLEDLFAQMGPEADPGSSHRAEGRGGSLGPGCGGRPHRPEGPDFGAQGARGRGRSSGLLRRGPRPGANMSLFSHWSTRTVFVKSSLI